MLKFLKTGFIIIVLVSLITFVSQTDLTLVGEKLMEVKSGFIWIIIVSFLAYLTGALAWQESFKGNKPGLARLLYIRTIGELIALFNPTNIIAGEIYKSQELKKDDFDASSVLDSILVSRAILIISQMFLTTIAIVYLTYKFTDSKHAILYSGLLLGLSVIVYLVIRFLIRRNSLFKLPQNSTGWLGKYTDKFRLSYYRIKEQLATHPASIVRIFFWSIIHWTMGALEICIILTLLGHPIALLEGISMDIGVVFFKSIGSIVPGQIGVEEFANKLLLDTMGLNHVGLWLSVSILRRSKQLFWILAAGLCYLLNKIFSNQNKIKNGRTVYHT